MEQTLEKLPDILLEDIKNNPELITGLFFNNQDVSVILEKRGDTVHFAYCRVSE
ncbi:MAG: hypothetical protein QME81_18365 [bacterium]|nr:hypothetical protein [bacterium]